jgi:hypothetical protein
LQIFNPMRYSKLSLARHEQVERPRPFAPRLRLLRSSESSDDSQHTHHHRASPGRVLGFSSPPVSALWCWHSTSSVRHRSGSPARKPASAAFPPVAWRGAFSRSSNTDRSAQIVLPKATVVFPHPQQDGPEVGVHRTQAHALCMHQTAWARRPASAAFPPVAWRFCQ